VRRRLLSAAVLLACAGLFALLCTRYDVVQDDAYISLVYSKNLVAGDGLVFNLGERVEGYTNFSWVILLALPHALGLDAVATARLFGVLSAAALILLSWRTAASLSSRPQDLAHLVAPCLLAANGALAFWTLSGMETAAFALLVTAGATRYLQRGRLDGWTGVLFGLAALTRPEGWMFFTLTVAHQVARLLLDPHGPVIAAVRQLWAAPVCFASLVLPHLAFRWFYYGQPLPNTFYAKTGISLTYLTHGLRYTAKFFIDYGLWGLAPLLVVALLARRRTRAGVSYIALLLFANVAYVTLVGGDTMAENRLYLPVLALLAAALAEATRVATLYGLGRRRVSAAVGILLLAAMVRSVTGPDEDLTHARDATMAHNAKLQELADYTNAAGEPFSLVASTAIGIPRYQTKAAVLDLVGLTDRTVAHEPKPLAGIRDDHILRNYHVTYTLDRAPDAILFITGMRPGTPAERALFLSQRFRRDYRLTYLQDHRPLYLRRPGEGHDEAIFADGAFIERYTEALGVMRQDPVRAIELFHETLRLGPSDFAMPHCWIGRLLYESGQLQEAANHLLRALAIDETIVMAWAHLALIDLMENGDGDAVTMARTAVELAPRSHFCRYVLGRILMAEDPASAVRELTIAVELGGAQTGDALYRLALAFERDHNTQAAQLAWTALLTLRPGDARAIRALTTPP
jgi:tetratricopeptide (TPR) repeat protein